MSFHYLLDDSEAQSDALAIQHCCPVQLTESTEQDWNVICVDAYTSINDLDFQHAFCSYIVRYYLDAAIFSEFQSVLNQVVEDLFETPTVSL